MGAKPARDAVKVREAVIKACSALLFESELDSKKPEDAFVLRRVLNELVWKYTEAQSTPGKYRGCPNWTEGALRCYEEEREWWKKAALEHVVSRDVLVSGLLGASSRDGVKEVLASSVTCVVLRTEHTSLPNGSGWERYEKIGIRVCRLNKPPQRPKKAEKGTSKGDRLAVQKG